MGGTERIVAGGLTLAALAAALAQASVFPAVPLALAALIAAASVVVAWRPAWVLVLLPAAMPVLDLAPWSGRLLWDEFDLLQLAVLPIVWLRTRERPAPPPLPPLTVWVFGLFVASLAVSLVRGGWPWPWPNANALALQHGPWNALRIGKGALWALALVAATRRLPEDPAARLRLFGTGLCLGLALTVGVVLWERWAFVGLFDFRTDYRVTGPFSAMATGGATIECFLSVAAAFALAALVQARRPAARIGLALLLVLTSYAVMVTYSRNGYAALSAAVLVVALALARRRGLSLRGWIGGAVVLVAMLAAAVPVLLGGYAQQRLAQSRQDLAVRVAHWRDALALREPDPLTVIFGEGLGRYPELHFWRSGEATRAGVFRLVDDKTGPLLRLGAGAAVYVEQVVDVGPGQRLELTLKQRSTGKASLGIALCEKWMLTSAQCARVDPGPIEEDAGWKRGRWLLDTTGWTASRASSTRPVKLALFNGSNAGAIDVADVKLTTEGGRALLVNGDFRHGFDHWYYTTDVDPPWHIHSLPVEILFEQGWLGVLAWSAAVVLALAGSARGAWRGDLGSAGLLAALLAFGVCGLVNSLADSPRMVWLACVLLWLGASCVGVGNRLPPTPS
jgi:hypothetical protein